MKEIWRRTAKVSAKSWLYVFIVVAIICIFALRHNNQTMVKLRQAVYTADKTNGDVNTALNNLRRYVYAHMNTDLSSGGNNIKPPIQLKYTYQRLYDAQLNQIQSENNAVYAAAVAYCQATGETRFDSPCVQNYVVNHGAKAAQPDIPAGLYEFDFISPTWSPDLAGFSLIASLILLAAFLVKFGSEKLRH